MTEWWRGGVIYQVYPRSFQDSSGNGVGDLNGIIDRLDHIASLGVDAVWLAPFFTSPMEDMGYDVADYCDVDPLFGTLADFDRLVEKAHALGLKLIIDQVISHTSDRHPWFIESRESRTNPKSDWYVWVDPTPAGAPPNNWASVFGATSWEWSATRKQYYLHNFLVSQPDLNFHNREVQDAVLDALRFWLERGVDGFRFDTVNFYFHDEKLRSNPPKPKSRRIEAVKPYDMQNHLHDKSQPENLDFLKRVRSLLDAYGAMSVGEVGDEDRPIEIMAAYTEGTERLHMAYSFEFLLADFSPERFKSRIAGFFAGAPDGWPCWSFSNHDVIRHVSRWGAHAHSREAMAKLAAAMLMSFRGSVCLYQGEELGLPEADLAFEELTDPPGIRFWPEYKGRDGCRTPMPWDKGEAPNGFSTNEKTWLPVKPEHSALNVALQNETSGSMLSFYRALLALRRNTPALVAGNIRFFETTAPVLAYRRDLGDQTIFCAFNLSTEPVTAKLVNAAGAKLMPHAEAALDGGTLSLPANGFAWIELDQAREDARVSFRRPKKAG